MLMLLKKSNRPERRRRRATAGVLLAVPFLLALASGANAALTCQDCHGLHHATTQAPQQCGDTSSCGTSCHTDKPGLIEHPGGNGTPLANRTTPSGIAAACNTCHQPSGAITTHPYWINVFPGTISAYPGVDQVCGQCHGGSSMTTQNGAPYISTATLAFYAKSMHRVLPGMLTPPVVGHNTPTIGVSAFSGATAYSVSFTDSSTFDPKATQTVTVNWGDGNVSKGVTGNAFTHTYASSRVRSYVITQVASDSVNPASKTTITVSVPQRFTVSGTIFKNDGSSYMSNARVYLKLNGHTRQSALTGSNGAFSFLNVLPGSIYTIRVYKAGLSFNDYAVNDISAATGIIISANP